MIHISKPYKEEREGRVYLVAPFTDESQNWSEPLWFSVTPEYGEYLCDEYADSFLLLALLPAIQSGQDIKIDAPVSRKLLFNINSTVKPIFNAVLGAPRDIRIEAAAVSEPPNGACGVGCGRAQRCHRPPTQSSDHVQMWPGNASCQGKQIIALA